MASSTILPPGRAARSTAPEVQDSPTPPPAAFEPPPPRRRAPLSSPGARRTDPADALTGLAFALALHLLVLLIVATSVRMPDVAALLAARETATAGTTPMLMIDVGSWPEAGGGTLVSATATPATGRGALAPTPSGTVLRAPAPGAPPSALPPVSAGAAPLGAGEPAGAPSGEGATPARDRFHRSLEALRPRLLDPRLRPGSADALRTDAERAAERVYARINALNDSILDEMERGRRATDWTFTDSEGRRWGVSPGKLHLGDLELPLPLNFTTAEQRERILEWDEIQAQAVQGEVDETFDDRVEAIRERRDAERSSDP